jgi:spore germination protein GerM
MKVHYPPLTHRKTIIGAALLLLTVTGGTAWWAWQAAVPAPNQPTVTQKPAVPTTPDKPSATVQPQKTPTQQQAATLSLPTEPAPSPQQSQSQERQPEIYWLRADGQQVSLVPQQVALNDSLSSEQALREGVINLLNNSGTSDQTSAIPAGTHLLSLRTTPAGIYIDLSREFSQGGGSSSMIHRVAQILYTVTSLEPNAKVYLSVEGQLLDENHPLGGEGLVFSQPLTRQQFTKDFSIN